MIQLESLKPFRKIDFIAVSILVILWAFITTIVNLPNTQLTFMISLLITTIFISFTALLIRRFGAVILFYFIGSIITIPFNNLIGGYYKILILLTAGIIFELFFFFSKIYFNKIPLNLVLGAAFSNASIPWTMLLLTQVSKDILPSVVNFSLLAFIIGIIGAIITFLIWYHIKGNKRIIKFEYSA